MTSYNDAFLPAGDESWNVFTDDSLSEHGTTKDVTDGAIGGFPHKFQVKFYKYKHSVFNELMIVHRLILFIDLTVERKL